MKIKEIMSCNPIVIPGTTSIAQIEKIFKTHKIWSVLVGDSRKYLGVITRKDLKFRRKDRKSSTSAVEIMSKNVYTIDQEDDVIKAISIILEKNVNGLGVTNHGLPCGIITRYDIREKYNPTIFNRTPSQNKQKIHENHSQEPKNQKAEKYDSIHDHPFQIALSFSGTFRVRVEEIAHGLTEILGDNTIFYDFLYRGHLAQADHDLLLQKIYRKNCELIVVFLSQDYGTRDWCKIEFRAIRELMNTGQSDKIMFLKFEPCVIPGLFQHDGYFDIQNVVSSEVIEQIIQRLRGIPVNKNTYFIEEYPKSPENLAQNSMNTIESPDIMMSARKTRLDTTRSITEITRDTRRLR
ncbi:MAG: CBS domain-containing protein [Methanoregula sp.]